MKKLIIGQIPNNFDPQIHIPISPICFVGKEHVYPGFEDMEFMGFSKSEYNYALLDEITSSEALRMTEQIVGHFFEKEHENFSARFWKALFYPWVGLFVPFLYRKQKLVEQVLQKYKDEELEIDMPGIELKTRFQFRDISDFINNGIRNTEFNEYLFSLFIGKMAPQKWKLIYRPDFLGTPKDGKSKTATQLQKHSFANRIEGWLYRSKLTYGFSHYDRVLFHFFLKFKKPINALVEEAVTLRDQKSILWQIDIQSILISFVPKELLEYNITSAPRKYRRGKIVNYSNSLYFNTKSRLDSAFAYEKGEIVIATQHGGHTYGSAESSEYIKNTELSADYFISWGWKNYKQKNLENIIVLPSPLLSKFYNRHKKKSDDFVFVGTVMNLYLDKFDSWMTENETMAYRKNKRRFLREFKSEFGLSKLQYKPYIEKNCFIQDSKYLQKEFPELRILKSSTKEFHRQLLGVNALILDHPGTTLNIAMAMNVPVLMFWSEEWFSFNQGSLDFLKRFKEMGIYYEKPSEVIFKLKEIQEKEGGVVKWWGQEKIQSLRQEWLKHFAYVEKNWRKSWRLTFRDLD